MLEHLHTCADMRASADMAAMPPAPIQRLSRLAPLNEIYEHIDALAKPVTPHELPIRQAVRLGLGEDAAAPASVPPCAIALRDGFAIASDRVVDAGPYAPVLLEPAPAWVESGDPLPAGADAVLPPEDVASSNGVAEVLAAASPG